MNPLLLEGLTWLKAGVDNAVSGASASVPAISAEALSFVETKVAPALDVPAPFIAALASENAAIKTPVDSFAVAELALLKARIDALFPAGA